MKCIALWIKVGLIIIVAGSLLVGCSSSKKKNRFSSSTASQSVFVNKNVEPSRNTPLVSSATRKKYEEALKLMKVGDYAKAEALFKQVSVLDANLAGPDVNLGIIQLKSQRYSEAEQHFINALGKNSQIAEVHNYLGIIYRQQGRFSDSEAAYKKAIQLNPMFAQAYMNLGVLYDLYLGRYAEALRNYKQYAVFKPNDKRVEGWIVDINQRMQASN